MNETLSNSIWPNFPTNSRPNWTEQQYSSNNNSNNSNNNACWQTTSNQSSSCSEFFQNSSSVVDFNNVWSSGKSEINSDDSSDKDSYIKSIWSSGGGGGGGLGHGGDGLGHGASIVTPTNSPGPTGALMTRLELVTSHERWGASRINQTTPWIGAGDGGDEAERSAADPMVWRARVDGTELWEEYYTRQHGQRRPGGSLDSGGTGQGAGPSVWSLLALTGGAATHHSQHGHGHSFGHPHALSRAASDSDSNILAAAAAAHHHQSIWPSNAVPGSSGIPGQTATANNNNPPNSSGPQSQSLSLSLSLSHSHNTAATAAASSSNINSTSANNISASNSAVVNSNNGSGGGGGGGKSLSSSSVVNNNSNNNNNDLIITNSSDIFGQNNNNSINNNATGFYGSNNNNNNSNGLNNTNNTGSIHSSFSNGIRPSMTRNQAQKYLQEMGFSLSDSIGALVNNQMDISKALNELQSKYRMSTNGHNISNSMSNQSLSFNRTSDNVNIARIPPGTPINPIVGQNSSALPSMMGSNFSNGIDMFHSDISDQMLENKFMMNMDQNMTAFSRMPPDSSRQQSMNVARQESFRNNFPNNNTNNGISNRTMSTNSGHFSNSDMNLLNQNMGRMNMNFNTTPNMMNQNNSFNIRPNNSNSFNGMHNNNTNPNLMLNNNNSNSSSGNNMDVRHSFTGGMPNVYGRSMSKPPMFQMSNSGMNWHTGDPSVMSPNGAIPEMSQLRLAKNLSMPDKVISIVIKKVQHKHIDYIKSLCMESGAMLNFHLNPQAQSIIVQFTNLQEAYRCINIIQNQLSLRVEQIGSQDEYMHYMSGAN